MMKTFMKAVLVFLLIVLTGVLLIALSLLLPQEIIHNNIYYSVDTFTTEGGFPRIILRYPMTTLDNNMDAWMLLLADYRSEDDSVLDQIFLGKYATYSEYVTGLEGFDNLNKLQTGEVLQTGSYSRYWHGWLFPLRLILCLTNYSGIRMMNVILMTGLFSLMLLGFARANRIHLIFPFFVSFIILMPVSLPLSPSYMIPYCIAVSASLLLMRYCEAIDQRLGFGIFFMIIGAVIAYCDFLTFPLITLGFPLIIYMVLCGENQSLRKKLICMFLCSASWTVGYCGMWAAKWVLASLFTSTDVIENALDQIHRRFSATADYQLTAPIPRFAAVKRNLDILARKPIIILCSGSFFSYVLLLIHRLNIRSIKISTAVKQFIPYVFIAVLPGCWFLCLANHSFIHCHFTYRILSVSAFALLAGLSTACNPTEQGYRKAKSDSSSCI